MKGVERRNEKGERRKKNARETPGRREIGHTMEGGREAGDISQTLGWKCEVKIRE